jgi:hypothetical protein
MVVYAGVEEQPKLGRSREDMTEVSIHSIMGFKFILFLATGLSQSQFRSFFQFRYFSVALNIWRLFVELVYSLGIFINCIEGDTEALSLHFLSITFIGFNLQYEKWVHA